MDLNGFSSTSIQPGNINLNDFAFSNIILASTSSGNDYKLPNANQLLQTFSIPNSEGKTITKVGDIWTKRYISQRTSDANLISCDASGSGSLIVKSNPDGKSLVTMCYLIWLTIEQPGDWSTLTGTYCIFGDAL